MRVIRTKPPELIGVAEVAEILGVHKPNVYRIPDLPVHVAELAQGRLWRRAEILTFGKKFDKRRRQPRKAA